MFSVPQSGPLLAQLQISLRTFHSPSSSTLLFDDIFTSLKLRSTYAKALMAFEAHRFNILMTLKDHFLPIKASAARII